MLGVVADKQCTCPASKHMWERYPPTPPFHCGENEIQASLISSASAGATPAPATNFGKRSGCRSVKPVSQNEPEATTGALPALPTISGSVAQPAEQPVVCGKAEGASPFGSANLPAGRRPGTARPASNRTKVPRRLPTRRGQTARSVAATCPAWDRVIAGASPAVRTIFSVPGSRFRVPGFFQRAREPTRNPEPQPLLSRITVVHPPVKRDGAGATPA